MTASAPLIAAGGPSYFCSHKSNQKGLSAEMLLCRTGPSPGKSGKTTGCKTLPHFVRFTPRFSNYCYALPSARAAIVLPYFIRSCSADGKTKKERWPDRKAGQAYGGSR